MQLVLCVGLQRSGTTAFSRFLTRDPRFAQPDTSDKKECNNACWRDFNTLVQQKGVHVVEPDDLTFRVKWATRLRIYSRMRPGRVLFIKTPKNAVRILALQALFPTAKIVFIKRNPLAILRSWWASKGYHHLTSGYYRHPYYRMQSDGLYYWQPPPVEGMDLAGWAYDDIMNAIRKEVGDAEWWQTEEAFQYRAQQLNGALTYHADHSAEIDRYLTIDYDQLCHNPAEELDRFYGFLGLDTRYVKRARTFFVSQDHKFEDLPPSYLTYGQEILEENAEQLGYSYG